MRLQGKCNTERFRLTTCIPVDYATSMGHGTMKGIRISEPIWKRCKIVSATLGIPMHKLVEEGLELRFKQLKQRVEAAAKVSG